MTAKWTGRYKNREFVLRRGKETWEIYFDGIKVCIEYCGDYPHYLTIYWTQFTELCKEALDRHQATCTNL